MDSTPPLAGPAGQASGMPSWLPRAVVTTLALLGCFQLAGWAFDRLVGLALSVLIAFFLALAMEPAVDRLVGCGLRRGLATGLVFLGALAGFAGFVAALGSVLAGELTTLAGRLPSYVNDLVGWTNTTFHTDLSASGVQREMLRSEWLREYAQDTAGNVLGMSVALLGGVFQLLSVLLFAFYFVADGPRLRRALCSVLPPARQAEVLRAWEIAVAKTGGYLYSRGLMALVSGLCHYVALELLRVPYAPVLALWVGVVSQFVPTVGTYLAGALPVLLACTVDPWAACWLTVFVLLYQQFENYLLQPRITAVTVDIHPAVAFGSVVAGIALMGAVGALIAVPATATLQGFLGVYVKRYEVTDPRASGARSQRRGWLRERRPPA
nr:AI-2E family transporter [Streptomyces oceani]